MSDRKRREKADEPRFRDERQKVIDRLRSLLAMTVENGCTPAEAESARDAA
jgi:hypothetical protein